MHTYHLPKWNKRPVTCNTGHYVSSNYVARMHGMKSAHLLILNNRNLHFRSTEGHLQGPNDEARRFTQVRAGLRDY